VLSPGFGSSVRDYEILAQALAEHHDVYRLGHSGSGRWSALEAGLRLLWRRHVKGESTGEAARKVRGYLHRHELRERRLGQLQAAVQEVVKITGQRRISIAGHSYGTDTALLYALRHGGDVEIETLYLFSPHPPGYLIAAEEYARIPARNVVVVTGTRDRTRDGVGPAERLRILPLLPPGARAIILPEVGHMDFAFSDLGPPDWPQTLRRELRPSGPGP
jgi:pimeloyl-ACP methyl ester carboxylesterase